MQGIKIDHHIVYINPVEVGLGRNSTASLSMNKSSHHFNSIAHQDYNLMRSES